MSAVGWKRLSDHLRARYQRGGYRNLAAFAEDMGVSLGTLDNLLHCRRTTYSDDTKAAVEIALDWSGGSFDRVATGGKPIPVKDPNLDRLLRAWELLSLDAQRMLALLAEQTANATPRRRR